MDRPKPCPECGCPDVNVDSSSIARQSWAECSECDYKIQAAVPEESIVKRWNKLKRAAQLDGGQEGSAT